MSDHITVQALVAQIFVLKRRPTVTRENAEERRKRL